MSNNPQTKGKVECFVKYVKENFLEGRIFTGIDSLNSAALAWLDTEANGTPNYDTKRIPREMFMEEAAALTKVPYHSNFAENIRNVSAKYDVTYLGSRYQLPKESVLVKEPIRIEEANDELHFIRTYDGAVIHTAQKAEKPGEHIPVIWEPKDVAVSQSTLKRIYDGSDIATRFIIGVEQQVERYKNAHYRWVIKLSRVYTIEKNKKVIFRYFDLNENGEKTYRRAGHHYVVEPIALVFNEDNYYLVSYSAKHDSTANYRVDRMDSVELIDDAICEKALELRSTMDGYTEQTFKMYGGQVEDVMLQFDDDLIGSVYDKFGEDTKMLRSSSGKCAASVKVRISPTFWGWLFQFGRKMEILSPAAVIEEYRKKILEITDH